MCSLAAVSALWLGAAVHDGIQQLKKTPLRMPKTSLKIYSRKVPPSPFPNSTIYSQKLILDEKNHILKYREFSACLGVGFPISSHFFLLSTSLLLLKLIRCLGTPDCVVPQPYICCRFRILSLKGWSVMGCLLWVCHTWKARCILPPNSILAIFPYAFPGAGSSQVSDISLSGKCTCAFAAVSYRPVWSTCDSVSFSWKM